MAIRAFARKFNAFMMQPTTIHGIAVLIGAAFYAFSGNLSAAAAGYALAHIFMPQTTPVYVALPA